MKPRILISNDDGIYAPGIMALYEALKGLGEIFVVAPESERSAMGHAITLADPIKIKKIQRTGAFEGYAVVGTPADCVKLAVNCLLDQKPDLVVSGINIGPNAGISVIYSGTVSAATEGTILGIPSIAVSLASYTNPLWETAGFVARRMAQEVLKRGLPEDTLLNVNVPNIPKEDLKGFAVTRMGRSRFVEVFHPRTTPRGDTYYWMDGELRMLGDASGTDFEALDNGYVSLTPIWFDLTNQSAMSVFKEWNLQLPKS